MYLFPLKMFLNYLILYAGKISSIEPDANHLLNIYFHFVLLCKTGTNGYLVSIGYLHEGNTP